MIQKERMNLNMKHFLVGVLTGGILFSSIGAYASTGNITVNFLPLRYFFDGEQKIPPKNQEGFVYKGTTYVPLRFVAESLGKKVEWDQERLSIYVGKKT
jgi:hypothetical protein